MPEQFVNPSPNLSIQRVLFFDFPAEGTAEINAASSYRASGTQPNYNLVATGQESLYGPLGNPPLEQGHPFMREAGFLGPGGEAEDPTSVDQIVDLDRGMELCHTGRLSGSLVPLLASKPHYSIVKIEALGVGGPAIGNSVIIDAGTPRWLEPAASAPNVWFYKTGSATNELLYSAYKLISQPIGQIGLQAESVYKLVYHWEFWRDTGTDPKPASPDINRPKARLPISGFDESIAFQVITGTSSIP